VADAVIKIENVGKRFRLGSHEPYSRFSELLMGLPRALFSKASSDSNTPGPGTARDFWALRGVSFDVHRGEILGVIGRNGAGKSTLLKILSRITEPTLGSVRIKGRVSALLEVGTGFHPELTGRENIFLNGAFLGMTRAEVRSRFDEIVAFAEVEKFLDTPVKHYSSGMYVRLGFAVAAHLQPDIMIVDEVLAVGDAAFQKKCIGKMRSVANEGRTVMMVSHNMASIVQFCGRVVALDAGRVTGIGAPTTVVEAYLRGLASTSGEVRWDPIETAPGSEIVRLRSVRILQPGSETPVGDVDISKEVIIEFTYVNFRPDTPLHVGLWLKHGLGTWVLSSHNMPSVALKRDEWMGEPFPAGVFQTTCRLPANFLNEGDYLITAILGRDTATQEARVEDCITFSVVDTGEMRADQTAAFGGVVRPKLDWETRQVLKSQSHD
jgi:lipopolysaccharide transport system ATP-binding protein